MANKRAFSKGPTGSPSHPHTRRGRTRNSTHFTKRNLTLRAAYRDQPDALLARLEGSKERACRLCRKRILAAVTLKLGNYPLVARDTFLALGRMLFGELQSLFDNGVLHRLTMLIFGYKSPIRGIWNCRTFVERLRRRREIVGAPTGSK